MTYRVRHRTEYQYDSDVSSSYGETHLLPRDLPEQRCHSTLVKIDPVPDDYRERLDFFGNRVGTFAIHRAHRHLTVTATSVVDVAGRQATLPLLADQPWEQVAAGVRATLSVETLDARPFVLESPSVVLSDQLADYARVSFAPGRGLLDAVTDLMHRIHTDFEFKPGATSVRTTLDELFAVRAGVCQDFAHLAIACLRTVGLPARYVSGYLETQPPPGSPRLVGADVSHAWASMFVPSIGWVDLDPTNNQFVNDRYVTVGWGRDYSDVPPLKGVIFTEGETHKLKVTVDVVPVGPGTNDMDMSGPVVLPEAWPG
jgi:transglutaminase-like putative cysteine protease